MRRPLFQSPALARVLPLVAALVSPGAAGAAGLDGPEAALGQWDMTLENGPRACRLALRPERVRAGFYIGLPHGCRRAIPALTTAASWTLPGDGHLAITDVFGKTLFDFAPQPDGTLAGVAPTGETFRLTFVGGLPSNSLTASATPSGPAAAAGRPPEIAGRYAVLRDGGRDTGCMVTLDPGGKAYLAPACRDQGIVTFDPTGWRLAASRLVLVARKGHTTTLDQQADGSWMKDAALGKSLGLKRL